MTKEVQGLEFFLFHWRHSELETLSEPRHTSYSKWDLAERLDQNWLLTAVESVIKKQFRDEESIEV